MLQHLKAVWTFRYFWASLVKMDLMTRYRKSVLGIGWSLLHPLGMTAIFCLVFAGTIGGGKWIPYAQQTLAGMAVFGFLRDCTLQGCYALTRNEAYIRQSPLPFGIYPLRTMLSNLVHFLITLAVLVVLIAILNGSGDVFGQLWKVLPMLVVLALCGWAAATVTAFATVYFHDISHLLELAAQLMFFMTPIIYGRELFDNRQMPYLVDWNPIAAFIEVIREPLVKGEVPGWGTYATVFGVTAGLTVVACLTIHKLSRRVIFQM